MCVPTKKSPMKCAFPAKRFCALCPEIMLFQNTTSDMQQAIPLRHIKFFAAAGHLACENLTAG